MNRDDIIRMALEADFRRDNKGLYGTHESDITPLLERFAALVAAEKDKEILQLITDWVYMVGIAEQKQSEPLPEVSKCEESIVQTAVKEEREACARIASSYGGPEKPMMVGTYDSGWFNAAEAIATDIRARGEK